MKSEDMQLLTERTIQNTDELLLKLEQIRHRCHASPPLLTESWMMDASPPPALVVDSHCNQAPFDDEITEKRGALPSLSWLSHLDREPRQQTRYTHPIKNSSLIDLFECGIIAHDRIPERILLSRYNHLIMAILGHEDLYHRSTGSIPLDIGEDLTDSTIVLIGSAESRRSLADQPTQELLRVRPAA